MHYNLNDIPDAVIELSEDIYACEERFQDFLLEQGIRDTRYVTQAKWDQTIRVLEEMKERREEEEEY
jgi:hypothetical protein